VDCSWGALLLRVPTTTDPVRYIWNLNQYTSSRVVIGRVGNRIGMTIAASGGIRGSEFVIELRKQVEPI